MDNQQLVHDLTALAEPHTLPGKPNIPEILARLDKLLESGDIGDARLRHFLANRSYVKALAQLREASDGSKD